MNIKETTPTIEKTFNIELNENELKLLGLIIGNISNYDLKELITSTDNFNPVQYDENFTDTLYAKIIKIF